MRLSPVALFRTLLAVLSLALASAAYGQVIINVPADQPTIQAAINAAADNYEIIVAPGVYDENLVFGGKYIILTSSGGAAVTTIDGSRGAAPAILLTVGTQTHHGVYPTVVNGFTIRGGGVEPSTTPTGGIVDLTVATISNNVITANHCAGIVVGSIRSFITGNEIDGTLDKGGDCGPGGGSGILGFANTSGGVDVLDLVTIRGNTIRNNTQGGQEGPGAGGITIPIPMLVQGNTITGNSSSSSGGGIYLSDINFDYIIGNLIANNTAACSVGGVFINRNIATRPLLLFNNTFANNFSPAGACRGGVVTANATQLAFTDRVGPNIVTPVVNNIFYSTAEAPLVACGGSQVFPYADVPIFDHNLVYKVGNGSYDLSCFFNAEFGAGNLNADPQFAPGTFIPLATSPAVDAGDTSVLTFEQLQYFIGIDTTIDLAGNPRVADATAKGYGVIDLGAYEVPGVADQQATSLLLAPSGVPNAGSAVYSAAAGDHADLNANAICSTGGSVGPQGPVAFTEDGKLIGSANLIAYNSYATLPAVFLAPGLHLFDASYAGQTPCFPGVAIPILYLVSNYQPALALTSSVNPSTPGQAVTFSVTFTSIDPKQTGPVTLTDNGNPLTTFTLVNGQATYTTSALTTGTHAILASYAGDATHNATSAGVQQVVQPAGSTTLNVSSDLNPSAFGQAVDFYFTVTPVFASGGTAKGSVTVLDGATPIASVTLDNTGSGVLTTSTLAVGDHSLTFNYTATAGSGLLASSGNVLQTVLSVYPTSLRLTSSKNPSAYLQSVTFVASVSSNTAQPTGSVQFFDGAALLGSGVLNASSVATLATAALAPGAHTISASYVPDPYLGPSSAMLTQNVTPPPGSVTASPEPSALGQPYTITAAVPGPGTVTFLADGVQVGTATIAAGTRASIAGPVSLAAGTHTLTASYVATQSTLAVVFTGSHTVTQGIATGTLTAAPEPSYSGQTYATTITLAGPAGAPVPTGKVVLSLDGTILASSIQPAPPGTVYTTTFNGLVSTTVGPHVLSVAYSGDNNYAAQTLTATHNVTRVTTTVVLTPTTPLTVYFGQPIDGRFAILDPQGNGVSSTGTYTLFDNGVAVPVCTALLIPASCPYGNPILLDAGPHAFSIQFSGDAMYAPSTSAPILYTVLPDVTTATLTSSLNPSQPGQTVVFSVAIHGNIVNPAAGSVQLFDGSNFLTTLTLSQTGTASITLGNLALGSHSLSVVYPGALDFLPITSAPLIQVVSTSAAPPLPATFTLTVSPTPLTIGVGRTANFLVTVSPSTQSVALSCSSLAPETACTFFLPTIPIGGGTTGMQLSTMAPHDCGDPEHPYFLGDAGSGASRRTLLYGSPIVLAALALFGIRRRKRLTRLTALALLTALGFMLSSLSGCGHCTDLGTRPGAYTFTVTGTGSAGESASQPVRINVTIP